MHGMTDSRIRSDSRQESKSRKAIPRRLVATAGVVAREGERDGKKRETAERDRGGGEREQVRQRYRE
jgi:hypothetical protein